jgi:hypothetical protein
VILAFPPLMTAADGNYFFLSFNVKLKVVCPARTTAWLCKLLIETSVQPPYCRTDPMFTFRASRINFC